LFAASLASCVGAAIAPAMNIAQVAKVFRNEGMAVRQGVADTHLEISASDDPYICVYVRCTEYIARDPENKPNDP
jgi:hypothetical protein